MRTQEQIIHELKTNEALPVPDDLIYYKREVLTSFLTYDQARDLSPDIVFTTAVEPESEKRPGWKPWTLTEEAVRDYLEEDLADAVGEATMGSEFFVRSIEALRAWLWLLDDSETLGAFDRTDWNNYGAKRFKVVIDKYAPGLELSEEFKALLH